jgi:hypothetical protein
MVWNPLLCNPFVIWLQQPIKPWAKPTTLLLASGILSDLTCSRSDLIAENALSLQELIALNRQVKRPLVTGRDRFWLVILARCTHFWRKALQIIQGPRVVRMYFEFRFDSCVFGQRSQGDAQVGITEECGWHPYHLLFSSDVRLVQTRWFSECRHQFRATQYRLAADEHQLHVIRLRLSQGVVRISASVVFPFERQLAADKGVQMQANRRHSRWRRCGSQGDVLTFQPARPSTSTSRP